MKKDRIVRGRLSLATFVFNFSYGSFNQLSLFLKSLGISASQIGIITSFTNIVNIISQPIWGAVSDRVHSVKKTFMLCLLIAGGTAAFIPVFAARSATQLPTIVNLLILYFFFMPAVMLMEQWMVRVNENPNLNVSYGSVRIWASIGFAAISLCYVIIFRFFPVYRMYTFVALFVIPAVLLALRVPDDAEVRTEAVRKTRFRDMPFKKMISYWVITYLIFEIIFQIPFGWCASYSVYAFEGFGVGTTLFGAMTFISTMSEVPMFLLARKFIRKMNLTFTLVIGLAGVAASHCIISFGGPLWLGILAMVLRGSSFALVNTCRFQYVFRAASKGIESSTQAVINSAFALTNVIAAATGGFVFEKLGVHLFFRLTASLTVFAGLYLLLVRFIGRKTGREVPEGC